MKLASALITFLTCTPLSIALADEAADMSFAEGSVIVRCDTPSGQDNTISNKLFEAAFPNWIISLQKHANEGRIARAHYLGALKEGILIVIIGDSKQDALGNSEIVLADLGKIMKNAIEKTGDTPPFSVEESCVAGEIGPVAILPR